MKISQLLKNSNNDAKEMNLIIELVKSGQIITPIIAEKIEDFLKKSNVSELEDLIVDGGFVVEMQDIEEMHIYNVMDIGKSLFNLTWPIIGVKNGLIELSSAFGWGKEDYILCKKCKFEG